MTIWTPKLRLNAYQGGNVLGNVKHFFFCHLSGRRLRRSLRGRRAPGSSAPGKGCCQLASPWRENIFWKYKIILSVWDEKDLNSSCLILGLVWVLFLEEYSFIGRNGKSLFCKAKVSRWTGIGRAAKATLNIQELSLTLLCAMSRSWVCSGSTGWPDQRLSSCWCPPPCCSPPRPQPQHPPPCRPPMLLEICQVIDKQRKGDIGANRIEQSWDIGF